MTSNHAEQNLGSTPEQEAPSDTGHREASPHEGRNAKALRRFVTEFINGGDESCLEELVHADYIYRSPDEEVRGRAGLAAMFCAYRAAFPDMALTVHELLVDGDKTVLDFSLGGTHEGDFMGMPASGRGFGVRGVVISRFRDGKIAEEWEILDTMSLLQQLGAT